MLSICFEGRPALKGPTGMFNTFRVRGLGSSSSANPGHNSHFTLNTPIISGILDKGRLGVSKKSSTCLTTRIRALLPEEDLAVAEVVTEPVNLVEEEFVPQNNKDKMIKTVANILGLSAVVGTAAIALSSTGSNPWEAYQTAVKMNPIETKACISGVVYSLGDLIAQSYEGRDASEWDRGRVIRSGLCGLIAHGPLSHLYYVGLDTVFAQQDWIDVNSWVTPLVKVGIDQTAWSLFWNSTYYVLLGLMKAERPDVILSSVQQSWWDLLKAGWRLWPMVHLCTYGIIPVQHRLLFVDAVELAWVCILSTYGQQQRVLRESSSSGVSQVLCALPSQAGAGGDFAEEIIRGIETENMVVIEEPGD